MALSKLLLQSVTIGPKAYIYGQTAFWVRFRWNYPVVQCRFSSSDYGLYDRTKFSATFGSYYNAERTEWTFNIQPLAGNTSNFVFSIAAQMAFQQWNNNEPNNFSNAGGSWTIPWYAVDPNPDDPIGIDGDTTYTEGGPSTSFDNYPALLASGALTPFNLDVVFSEAVYGFNPATELMVSNASKSSGVLTSSSPTIWNFTITPSGEPVQLFVPSRAAVSVETGLYNNSTPLLVLTTQPPLTPVLTVPENITDYVTPNQPYSIGINFNGNVYGFTVEDIQVTNASISNLTGGTNGSYNATITPSGTTPITYFIPSGVCNNEAGKPNLASILYSTNYSFSSTIPGSYDPTGSGLIQGGIITQAGASGSYTNSYLNLFNNNGTNIQLMYFKTKPNCSGFLPFGWSNVNLDEGKNMEWVYIPASGPYDPPRWEWSDIGWSGSPYTDQFDKFNKLAPYASGVPYTVKCFIDKEGDQLDTAYGSLNRFKAVYGIDNETGKIYFPPDAYLGMTQERFTVIAPDTGPIIFAEQQALSIRDVWVVIYNNNMWHIQKPIPRFLNNQLVFYESVIKKMGNQWDPFTFLYDGTLLDPVNTSIKLYGQMEAGYYFPATYDTRMFET